MTDNEVDNSSVPITVCPFEKWKVPKKDDAIIKEFSEDGEYIRCLPCSKYTLQVSRKMKSNDDETNSGLVKSFSGKRKFDEAYIERLVEANRNLSENTDIVIDDENAIEDVQADVLLVEEHESTGLLDEVDTGLTTLLHCKSLEEITFAKMKTDDDRKQIPLIQGLFEAFHMRNRDQGTVSNAQRHKGLVVRYSEKKEKKDDTIKDTGGTSKFIQRGSVLRVKLEGDNREKQFAVLALSDKFYSKWYMNEKGFKLPWVPEKMKNIKTRHSKRTCAR